MVQLWRTMGKDLGFPGAICAQGRERGCIPLGRRCSLREGTSLWVEGFLSRMVHLFESKEFYQGGRIPSGWRSALKEGTSLWVEGVISRRVHLFWLKECSQRGRISSSWRSMLKGNQWGCMAQVQRLKDDASCLQSVTMSSRDQRGRITQVQTLKDEGAWLKGSRGNMAHCGRLKDATLGLHGVLMHSRRVHFLRLKECSQWGWIHLG